MCKPNLKFLIVSAVMISLANAEVFPQATDFPTDGSEGPLGEWPQFIPIGFITAAHPDIPDQQTHLYGDWGSIVGEEFLFLQEDKIKLLYHSYHETYLTERTHEMDLLDGWALGYNKITKIKFTPLVRPGGPVPGPAWNHTDTPGYLQHPITGEHLIYHTVRPGTKHLRPEWNGLPGAESAIQVASSGASPSIGSPFVQTYENILVADLWWELGWNNNGVIKGGLSEPTPVWVPHLGTNGKVRLFYRGLHGSSGSYWNWRISYADSEDGKTSWIKNESPTFDPSDPTNPAFQWTQPPPVGFHFRGAWQAHCTGDVRADGVHMVMTVSNQNYALGGRIAYYWSPDWGDTWIGHPDNPIIVPGEFPNGVPVEGFQRTPTLAIDEEYNRYVLAYNAGHDAEVQWQKRTYLAVADRPASDLSGVDAESVSDFKLRIDSITPNPGHGDSKIKFVLPVAGRLQVRIYGVDGRLVAEVADNEFTGGPHTLVWDKTTLSGSQAPSGIYLVRGSLDVGGRRVSETRGRIVVLK